MLAVQLTTRHQYVQAILAEAEALVNTGMNYRKAIGIAIDGKRIYKAEYDYMCRVLQQLIGAQNAQD